MKKLTDKKRKLLKRDVEIFRQDLSLFPRKEYTSRDKLFWDTHRANFLLAEDTLSGKAKEMKPKALWKSREEYQEFLLEDFRKHIYQERNKQLAGAYWQQKLRRVAAKKHRKAVKKREREFKQYHSNKDERICELVEQWKNINSGDE